MISIVIRDQAAFDLRCKLHVRVCSIIPMHRDTTTKGSHSDPAGSNGQSHMRHQESTDSIELQTRTED